MSEMLFSSILEIQGGSLKGGSSGDDSIMIILKDFQSRCPKMFNMLLINEKVKEKTPFIVVCLQECERMNELLNEIKTSLEDLFLGLTGALNMTDAMEVLQLSLNYNRVPDIWEKKAYFSRKNLASWFSDLIERNKQL